MNRNTCAINNVVHGIPVSTGVDGGSDDEDSEDDDDDEVEPEPAGDEYDDDDDLWPLSLNESGSTQYGLCRPRLPSSTLVALTERHSPGGGSDTAL